MMMMMKEETLLLLNSSEEAGAEIEKKSHRQWEEQELDRQSEEQQEDMKTVLVWTFVLLSLLESSQMATIDESCVAEILCKGVRHYATEVRNCLQDEHVYRVLLQR